MGGVRDLWKQEGVWVCGPSLVSCGGSGVAGGMQEVCVGGGLSPRPLVGAGVWVPCGNYVGREVSVSVWVAGLHHAGG